MLVLSRKINEKILFPQLGIALQIVRLSGGKVCLGIEAPGDVSIVRGEIANPEQKESFAQQLNRASGPASHEARRRLPPTLTTLKQTNSCNSTSLAAG